MIHVAMDESWKYKYELVFTLIQIQVVTYRNTYRYVINMDQYIYIYFFALLVEKVSKKQHPNDEHTQCSDLGF